MALLDDLGDAVTTGTTGVVGSDLFLGRLPDAPICCLAIADSGGMAGVYTMSTGPAVLERPRVQVLSRADTYSLARSRSAMVEGVLDGLRDRTINGTFYHWVQALQPAFLLHYDAMDRPVLAQNFEIAKARSTA